MHGGVLLVLRDSYSGRAAAVVSGHARGMSGMSDSVKAAPVPTICDVSAELRAMRADHGALLDGLGGRMDDLERSVTEVLR